MESYEVLEKAIPKKASERVALILNVSAAYVRQWRREPDSEDSPTASGRRSILDRICDLIDAVFLVNPKGCALVVQYVTAHYNKLICTHAPLIDCPQKRAETAAELLTEATEAINKLNLEGATMDTWQELVEIRDAADKAIAAVEKTIDFEANK